MQIQTLLLDLFAIIAPISAVLVITSTNPIHSVVFSIPVPCNAAGSPVLLKIEFIAMMFPIIYVGAIAVPSSLVVMMLNIKVNEPSENWVRYLPIGGVISVIFLLEIALFPIVPLDSGQVSRASLATPATPATLTEIAQLSTLYNDHYAFWDINQRTRSSLIDSLSNIQSLGYLIYTYHFHYFPMASLILLIAMIGAIVLTMHKRRNASRKQLIFKQIARNLSSAVAFGRQGSSSPECAKH